MAYDDDERSAHASDPTELYEFLGPQVAYRYTSRETPQVFGGHLYAAIPISRGSIPGPGTNDPGAITVRLPATTRVVLDYALGRPLRQLALNIYRVQAVSGEAERIWTSTVTSPRIEGRWAELRSPSKVADRLGATVPAVSFQRLCNHFLYDQHCRKNRIEFQFATAVAAVDGRTITVASIGGRPDDWFRAGEIVRDLDGERRMVVRQVGSVLELASPFRELVGGDAVTLYAGCDHTVETCRDKFANVVNFGGHPTIPRVDVFQINIRGIEST